MILNAYLIAASLLSNFTDTRVHNILIFGDIL